jgi:hypothetical protein
MVTVFELRKAKQHIESVQQATLTTWKWGIAKTHGLFGSDEWWRNIDSGKLPVHTLNGIITRLFMGGMRDTPEFTMRSDDGRESNWLRYANVGQVPDVYVNKRLEDLYEVSRRIEIDYVLQRNRFFGYGNFFRRHKVVIEVRIGNDA